MTRKTSQLSNVASTDAPRIPSWASCNCSPSKVMWAMSSATVKPMPATVAAPTSGGHGIVSGNRPSRRRVANQVAPVIPTSLPTTRPQTMPSVMREVSPRSIASRLSVTPALASANTGTIT